MKPNEIRISNYLLNQNGNITQVQKISSTSINNAFPHQFIGIDLTAEILEKCGVKKVHFGGFDAHYFQIGRLTLYRKYDGSLDVEIRNNTLATIHLTNIKYLHELQNIVLDITGEELTVKL